VSETESPNSPSAAELEPQIPEILEADEVPPAKTGERSQSTTIGTGSYIAVSCSAVMMVLTLILIGIMLLIRWI